MPRPEQMGVVNDGKSLPPRDNRVLFDLVAEQYDRARPTYPEALFDDIVALSAIPTGGRILEIGCGTGQATRPMAERGYRITAIELGPHLAAVAHRNLSQYGVDVQVGAFEDWTPPEEPFDLVMCVSAFHWLDHALALPKIARILKPKGALTYTTGGHVEGGTSQFFIDAQECYIKHMPGTPPGIRLSEAGTIPLASPITDSSGLFAPAQHRRHLWLRDFTTATCIAKLIDERYGGHITKAYLTDLHVAAVK